MPRSIRDSDHAVRRSPGDAVEGDKIMIECRKPGAWETVRASENHHYFQTSARKNAYAVVAKTFTNLKDG